ncbi:MAG: hypothetical protein HYY16_01855 [Planctomycetes bacterium]|nr:hypothetical protein [Planctomycetota bacterium]
MRTWTRSLPLMGTLLAGALLVSLSFSTPSVGQDKKEEGKFLGAEKCKKCHEAKAKGNQFGKWKETKHAKAFEALATEDAKKFAKERGVEDPQKDEKCLKCHVTALGVPQERLDPKFDIKLGVQCESCHGTGDKHVKARMSAEDDEDEAAIHEQVKKEMPLPDPKELCSKCHNPESPTIEHSQYWDKENKVFLHEKAIKEIEHPNPKWKK